ncbi:hypothetical protein OAO55_03215, partial [Bacteroidales bacterium]|nr:hypothetical protein [Bacteroidales bacterium]
MIKRKYVNLFVTFLLLLLINQNPSAQNYWEDSQVYTVGSMPHTCTHIPYADAKSAIEGTFEASDYFMS